MNWKLILQLSVFGLIMAIGTVSLIPEKIEPLFWLAIFCFCAFVIAKACADKYFLHGFLVCLFNCLWLIAVHLIFKHAYITAHPDVLDLNKAMPLAIAIHPRMIMVITGLISGIVAGVILGLFSFAASRMLKK